MNTKKIVLSAATLAIGAATLVGCSSDADVAAHNISVAAEQFEVNRRIVFINGITDEYLLEIQGLCSVETSGGALNGALEVTCKVGPSEYKKHFLGLSDNVTFFAEQIDAAQVGSYHYRVIFKPTAIVPDIEVK